MDPDPPGPSVVTPVRVPDIVKCWTPPSKRKDYGCIKIHFDSKITGNTFLYNKLQRNLFIVKLSTIVLKEYDQQCNIILELTTINIIDNDQKSI